MPKTSIKVAVLGASGYTGGELLRLLSMHPYVNVTTVTADKSIGLPITSLFPNLETFYDLTLEPINPKLATKNLDLIFMALPHMKSMNLVAQFIKAKKPVIDLSGDFRLREPSVYKQWYGTAHSNPTLLKDAVYGLPELHRTKIIHSHLIAIPGCYPTVAILQLAPLLANHVIQQNSIVIDAKSGISGAGRNLAMALHFPEAHDSLTAYKIAQHRHTPEIEQELNGIVHQQSRRAISKSSKLKVVFTPHLTPLSRGILSTAYARLTQPMTTKKLQNLYRKYYKKEDFIRIRNESTAISPNQVRGSNFCDIGIFVDSRTNNVISVGTIDNLVKGASGQAVQVMNLIMGYPEKTGLTTPGIFP